MLDDVWSSLREHQIDIASHSLKTLFEEDPERFDRFSLQAAGLLVDYSKNLVSDDTIGLLLSLAEQAELKSAIASLFAGDHLNSTENRPAMHMALRSENIGGDQWSTIKPAVQGERAKMRSFVERLHNGEMLGCTGKPIRHIVNIGIGGSDLGLVMGSEALKNYHNPNVSVHFVSSIDGNDLRDTFAVVDPEHTLFIICSKSFTTLETLTNAKAAQRWMASKLDRPNMEAGHFAAVSVNLEATNAFGISQDNVFAMWDWVGGRYSVCSAVGLALACAVGMNNFEKLLQGCAQMDEHFLNAPLDSNLPVILGLLAIWYNNFFGAQSHAILPYDNRLQRFPAYLQQLQMESNGKRVDRNGRVVPFDTGQIIWGEPGPNAQHSFYQLLHQGTRLVPVDFLVPKQGSGFEDQHKLAMSACFAQSRALAMGQSAAEVIESMAPGGDQSLVPHRVHPGNRPSTTIVFNRVDPINLGRLIALYEHKVFVESVIWGINPFDQFGVELGKRLASDLEPGVRGEADAGALDASTRGLCDFIRKTEG
ncbi:MAG: glucose-6-phosphate isomerase [Pseudomonadota bacterium]